MAGETQTASVGYKDEVWLHDGAALYKLRGVTGFDIPVGGQREQIDVTDLDADDWRRQYISGFYEDSDFTITLNYRPTSDTDILLTAARDEGDNRDFKVVLAIQGTPTQVYPGVVRCIGYGPDSVSAGGVKTATATFRVVSVDTPTAYTPPAP